MTYSRLVYVALDHLGDVIGVWTSKARMFEDLSGQGCWTFTTHKTR